LAAALTFDSQTAFMAAAFSVRSLWRHADARRVLRWLKAKGDLKQVSREEIRRGALGKQRDADTTQEILAHLTRAGWLRRLPAPSGEQGGRPALRWEVNPRLLKKTEE
jgi:hypothetical protein